MIRYNKGISDKTMGRRSATSKKLSLKIVEQFLNIFSKRKIVKTEYLIVYGKDSENLEKSVNKGQG